MHDIRAIRENPQVYVAGWSSRGVDEADGLVADILRLDAELRHAQTTGQDALAKRNAASKLIGAAMGRKDMDEADRLKAEVEALKGDIAAAAEVEARVGKELRDLLAAQKNLAAEDVPDGEDEAGNLEVSRWGTPREGGPAKDHADLGEALGMLDFEAAARMSGARFAVLKGQLARLERAVGQFMLDLQTDQHGYLEVNPPLLVRDEAMFGTGQLPKFEEDLFKASHVDFDDYQIAHMNLINTAWLESSWEFSDGWTNPPEDLVKRLGEVAGEAWRAVETRHFLIPTAEVSLTNLIR
ncbi:MAG: serine--tRNA ligase, partial [Phenylobacterium sp.]|nr:serine--tRNA ligase [Phenylobacterium sp.]